MAYDKARFIVYYKDGTTRIEDRSDPHCWDNIPKYEYLCPECGQKYPYFPEATMTDCLKCLKEDKEIKLVRQTMITALGIQFDPLPLAEEGDPVLSKEGRPLRVRFPPHVLKGSSVYNYGFFQDKPAEQQIFRSKGTPVRQTFGIRVGMVVDPEGHCFCLVGYLGKGQPATYSYYSNVHSLGIDENARKLHQLKLEECGQRVIAKKGEKIRQKILLNLGERLET